MSFETFDHTADVGLRITAPDLDRLFADAGRGLFSLIVPNLESVEPRETIHVEVAGDPSELLLFDWLNELLYIYDTRRLLLAHFEVKVSDSGVSATARGEPIDDKRHQLDHELKAITYHGLRLERQGDGWLAEVIVDI